VRRPKNEDTDLIRIYSDCSSQDSSVKKTTDFSFHSSPEIAWEIERRLSEPTFRGVPIGSVLANLIHLEIFAYNGDWSAKGILKNIARYFYHHLYQRKEPAPDMSLYTGRVLVTWIGQDFRCSDLIFPIVKHLGCDRCVVLYPNPEMAAFLPPGVMGLNIFQASSYDIKTWRRDYLRFWKDFRPTVKQTIRELGLPSAFYYRLADAVLTSTQSIAGSLEFLQRSQVAAVLTEHDRNWMPAPLVLSAKTLGIPTYTMMHGTPGEKCFGFQPLLADTIFCWGELFKNMFLSAGVDESMIEVAGCPRLTRDLPMSAVEARMKIGIAPDKPVVMLATSNFRPECRLQIAETFCEAVKKIEAVSGVVRLHPKDELQMYSELVARFPGIKFMINEECTLDEALAAADIIVTHSSGVGSDALVKRRLTVVLDVIDLPLGHGRLLIEFASCPHATSSESLLDILRCLLNDAEERGRRQQLAEAYVRKFCAYFGNDAAKQITDTICRMISA